MKKEFIKLSVPNILTNLTIPLVSAVDVALVGRMPSSYYIIAIGFGTVIFNFLYWAFGFLRMGTTGLVSQAYGADKFEDAKLIFVRGLTVALIISLLILLLKELVLSASIYIIQPDAEVLPLLEAYYNIRIYAAPATISLYVIVGWLLGMQDSKQALLLALILNFFNILLSYLFVWEFNLFLEGVAWGTVLAQYIGVVVGVIVLKKKYQFRLLDLKLVTQQSFQDWKEFLSVNKDIFIRTLCLIFALSFFKTKAANIDPIVGAANILLLEFVTISAYGIDGLAFAAESISGKYFGKGIKEQLTKSIKIAFRFGIGFGVLITLLFWLLGEEILYLLTNKRSVIDAAMVYLPWLIIAPIINSFAFIWDGVYIGCTATKEMMYSLLISTFLVFLPAYFIFSGAWLGNHGIWLALSLFMLARGVIQTVLARKAIYQRL